MNGNFKRQNMSLLYPSNTSRCDYKPDIFTWRACNKKAWDLEIRGFSRKIKTSSLILMLTGIVSSSLVCMVVLRGRRVRQRTISNALILNLSIADIMFRIVYVITQVIIPTMHIGVSAFECKLILYSHYACAAVTFALLAAIAVDRYQQIVHPLKYFYLSKFRRVLVVLSLWFYAVLVSLGFIFVGEDEAYERSSKVPKRYRKRNSTLPDIVIYRSTSKQCTLVKNSFSSQLAFTPYLIFGFLAPLAIIVVAYSVVFRFLRSRSKHNINKVTARSKRKALKMLIIVVVSFVVCWVPIMSVDFMRAYGLHFRKQFRVRHIAEAFSHLSSIFCPVIYAFCNANFRRELGKILISLKSLGS